MKFLWILEGSLPYTHRSLADGSVEMVFHYKGSFDEVTSTERQLCATSSIQGPSSQYRVFTSESGFGIFGVYLYPFAIKELFGIPVSEISNEKPDLLSFLGQEGLELQDRMIAARDNAERMQIISDFLTSRLCKGVGSDARIHRIIHSIQQAYGQIDIQQLAQSCFLSRRQFERKFKASAGFSPKMYARIIRFQHAADAYAEKNRSLAQLALDCGYYDQAHFTNDFSSFSGFKPREYFSGKVTGVEWREATSEMSHSSKT